MASNKQVKRNFIIVFSILVVGPLSLIATISIDCNGKAFHCVNSTHFKICVDFGGISKTVDDFLIPCPESTVCTDSNYFECEYQITTTPVSIIGKSDVTNKNSDLTPTTAFDAVDVTTLFPIEYENKPELFENYYAAISTTSSDSPRNEMINNLLSKKINQIGYTANNEMTEKEQTNVMQNSMNFNLTDMNITTPIYLDNNSEIMTDLTETTIVGSNIKLNEINNETISIADFKSTSKPFNNELESTSTIKSGFEYREQFLAIDQKDDNELSTIRTIVNYVTGINNIIHLSNKEKKTMITNAPFSVRAMIKSVNDVPVTISINKTDKDEKLFSNGIVNLLSPMINQKSSYTGATESSKGLLISMITESSNKEQLTDYSVDSVTVIKELPYITTGSDYLFNSQYSVNDTTDNNIYGLLTPTSQSILTTNNNTISVTNPTVNESNIHQISTEKTPADKLEFILTRTFSNTSPRSVTNENFSTVQEWIIDKVNILKNNSYNPSTSASEIPLLENETIMSQSSPNSETKVSSLSTNFIKLENHTYSYLTDTEQISTIKTDNFATLTTSNNIIPTSSTEENLNGAWQKLIKPDSNNNEMKISDLAKINSEISSNFFEIDYTTTLPTIANINIFSKTTNVFDITKLELSTSSNKKHHNSYNIPIKDGYFIDENEMTESLPPIEQNTLRPNMFFMKMTTKDINNLSDAVNKTMNDAIPETSRRELGQLNKVVDPLLSSIQNDLNTETLKQDFSRNSLIPLTLSGISLANEEQNYNTTDMSDIGDVISTTIVTQTLDNHQDLNIEMYNNNSASTPLLRTFLNAENNVPISTTKLNESSNNFVPYLTETEQMPTVLDFLSTPTISSDTLSPSTLISSINTVQDSKDEIDVFNNTHILSESTSDIPFHLFDYVKVSVKYIADNNKDIHDSTIKILTTTPAPVNMNNTTKNAINNAKFKVSILKNGTSGGSLTEVSSSLSGKKNLNNSVMNLFHDNINLDLNYIRKNITLTQDDILPTPIHADSSIAKDAAFIGGGQIMDVIFGGNLPNLNHSSMFDKETIMVLNKNYSHMNNNLLAIDSKIITNVQFEEKNNSILIKPSIEHNITKISNQIQHSKLSKDIIVNTNSLNFDQIDTMTDIPKNVITADLNNMTDYNGTTSVNEFSNMSNDTNKTSKGKNMFTKVTSKSSMKDKIKVIYLNETNKVSGKETYNEKLDLNTLSKDNLLLDNVPLISSTLLSTELKTTIKNLTSDNLTSLNYGENDYIHNLPKNQTQQNQYNMTQVISNNNENTLGNKNDNYIKINTKSNVRLNEKSTLEVSDEKLSMLKLSEANKTRTHNLYIANLTMPTVPTNATHSMIVNDDEKFKNPLPVKVINSQRGNRINLNILSNSNISTIENVTLKSSLTNIPKLLLNATNKSSIKDSVHVKVKDIIYNISLLENAENLVASTVAVSKLNKINYFNKSNIVNNTGAIIKNNNDPNISSSNSIDIKNYPVKMLRDQTINFNKKYSAGSNVLIKNLPNSYFNCKDYRNGKYSDKNDCTKFYICIGRNEPIIGTCPNNTVFSEIKKHCTKNLSYCVRNNQFLCKSVGRYIDVFSNQFYYICVRKSEHFIRLKMQCNKGYHLERTKIGCVLDSLNMSIEDTSYITTDGSTVESTSKEDDDSEIKEKNFVCEVEGNFPYPYDCRKFYSCIKKSKYEFRRRIKKCDSDEVFNKEKKKCIDDDSYDCDSNE